jgi:hypothetical protein
MSKMTLGRSIRREIASPMKLRAIMAAIVENAKMTSLKSMSP